MGSHYQFKCGTCGFEIEMSGGFDFGMVAATQTISCRDCGTLMDVHAGEAPTTSPKDVVSMTLHCSKSREHEVAHWNHPGPCPKCGMTMARGPQTMLWD